MLYELVAFNRRHLGKGFDNSVEASNVWLARLYSLTVTVMECHTTREICRGDFQRLYSGPYRRLVHMALEQQFDNIKVVVELSA